MDDLVAGGVKLLVLACNSASAACLRDARERYEVPVVEVVLPAARRAVHVTRNGRVGVLGTRATIASRAYDDALHAAPGVELTSVACPRLVDFVERGETTGPELEAVVREYLEPVLDAGCDTVVLGCTHYPLLAGVLSLVAGPGVTFVSSAQETALDVYRVLARVGFRDPSLPPPVHDVRATGDPEPFDRLARRFLGPAPLDLPVAEVVGTTTHAPTRWPEPVWS